jgi:Cd2+/Zn2+-exporting ATPase
MTPEECTSSAEHHITDHEGILSVAPQDDGARLEIAFDSSKLSEADLRRIAAEHLRPALDASRFQRTVLRLDGEACEAAAARLERRIEAVPGVRRATATYIGRVLCLTFDAGVSDETKVLEGVKAAGARIEPLEKEPARSKSLPQRLIAGELNEELSCGIGLVTLIVAAIMEYTFGRSTLTLGLYTASYFFGGQYGVRSAIASLREKTLDVDLLMVLAALGAAAVGAPLEGAMLLFLFSFSNILQHHALRRTQRAIESLLTLRPDKALRKTANGTELVPIDSLEIGETVVVRPGELIPVDGVVSEGRSNIDESSLTGESIPVAKSAGAHIFAGTLNQSGALEVFVSKKSEDSTLAKMVRLVAEAQAEKSRTQRFLEKAEQSYAAGVIAFTFLVLIVPWIGLGEDFSAAFLRAMTVMVVASPCALIISTPATVLSAIGGAARRGILIKGGSHLETAARVDIVCFDKTGTLTVGKPALVGVMTTGILVEAPSETLPSSAADLLRICAALEEKSEHPLAAAILRAAAKSGLDLPAALSFQSVAGKGAEATIEGVSYVVGSAGFLREMHATGMEAFASRVGDWESNGKTCIWLARRSVGTVETLAVFALADTMRPEARTIVHELHAAGVKKVIMLTGDQEGVARAIAQEANIDEFRAGLLPADKVQAVRELKKEGTVMMVGDGVNDAPALATAHLGVAMGAAGTDVAMETADVVLMGDKLENIPVLVGMARHARKVLIQNLTFATSVIIVLVAAALGFALPLPIGVIGHEGSTVLVCLNGLRLLAYRSKGGSGSEERK